MLRCSECGQELEREMCTVVGMGTLAFPVKHAGPCGLPCRGAPQDQAPAFRAFMHTGKDCPACTRAASGLRE